MKLTNRIDVDALARQWQGNREYQRERYRSGSGTLISELRSVLVKYQRREGVDRESALRDVLTELRHMADVWGLDFGEISDSAHAGYLEEIAWSEWSAEK